MSEPIFDALRRGDVAAALAQAYESAAASPNDAGKQHVLGLCLQHAGDPIASRAAILAAIALQPAEPAFHSTLASLDMGVGNLEQARAAASAAVAADPNHLRGYVALVSLALAGGEFIEAERYLRLAQRANAGHPRTLVAEAQLYQAKSDTDSALRCLTRAVVAHPSDALVQATLGMAYLARGQESFAEQALRNALELVPGEQALIWPLMETLRRQGKAVELGRELDRVLELTPGDAKALAWRAALAVDQRQLDRVSADLGDLVDRQPGDEQAVSWATALLGRLATMEQGQEWLDQRLAKAPASTPLWRERLALTEPVAIAEQLERWQALEPSSPARWSWMAAMAESRGQFGEAEALAEQCLGLDEHVLEAQLVKLRAETRRREPELGERLAKLESWFPVGTAGHADLAQWRPLALDALDRFAEAARSMARSPMRGQAEFPLPKPQPARSRRPADGKGYVLWGLPGSRIERLVDGLEPVLGPRLWQDRVFGEARGDGFDRLRRADSGAASAANREEAIARFGGDPTQVVDWLPHCDAETIAALRGTRLWVTLRDPRDQLLNWMAYGTRLGYTLDTPMLAAGWMAQVLTMLADALVAEPEYILLLRTDTLETDASSIATQLADELGLEAPPTLDTAGPRRRMLGGLPSDFPAGHWRQYEAVLTDAFELLRPVAERLGYPTE